MKNFIQIDNNSINFGSCENCDAKCCKGENGTIFSQILKEEFETLYEIFPILFIFGNLNFLKPVILLSDGFNSCFYLKNNICSIYKNRPKVCKNYPFSPNIDNKIYIDNSCPEVYKGENKITLLNYDFKNYQDKYIETHYLFENLNKNDLKKVFTIKAIDFYKYIGKDSSRYLTYHKKSLKNLKNYKIL